MPTRRSFLAALGSLPLLGFLRNAKGETLAAEPILKRIDPAPSPRIGDPYPVPAVQPGGPTFTRVGYCNRETFAVMSQDVGTVNAKGWLGRGPRSWRLLEVKGFAEPNKSGIWRMEFTFQPIERDQTYFRAMLPAGEVREYPIFSESDFSRFG